MKKMRFCLALLLFLLPLSLTGCDMFAEEAKEGQDVLYVYNWGDYIDAKMLKKFEEETGIHVVLDEYVTNESMYPRIAEGAEDYDVLCPSDYMVSKLIRHGLLQPLDFEQLPHARQYIGEDFFQQVKTFDREGKYTVPYCWGTVGIIYNTRLVDDPVDSWQILWNEKYRDNILMQDSARDSLMIPLKLMGKSMNTLDESELMAARDMLIEQKPLVQAYGVDDIRDKMISGEAALGVTFSGEAINMIDANEDLAFLLAPKEGTNVWIDGWVIPKSARHPKNAHKFIDFMCRPDVAAANFLHLGYSTPNTAVKEQVAEELGESAYLAFPPEEVYEGQESYRYLGEKMDKIYTRIWLQVKNSR